eukprot:7089708-Pyramimonas_sp.AAC.1
MGDGLRGEFITPQSPIHRRQGPDSPPRPGACGFSIGGPSLIPPPMHRRFKVDVSHPQPPDPPNVPAQQGCVARGAALQDLGPFERASAPK